MLSTIFAAALSLTAAPVEATPTVDNTSITSQEVGKTRGKVRVDYKRAGKTRGKVRVEHKRVGKTRGKVRV